MFDLSNLPQRVMMYVIPLILSLSVHEWAHAYSAYRLGDDTASREGRLTLNPISHIDVIGTLMLPLLGVPFGWAKPVPVNPVRFRRDVSMRTGMMITAAAGPFSNLVIAVLCVALFGLAFRVAPDLMMSRHSRAFAVFMSQMVMINVALALFNMLPIPPLDGSRVVDGVVPYRLRPQWERFTQYSAFVLLAVILFGQYVLARPFGYVIGIFQELMWRAAGLYG